MGKKKNKAAPMPTAEDNPEFTQAAESIRQNLEQPKKRHRRTKAEIEAEKQYLTDQGWELFRDFFKMFSDNDSRKFGMDKQPPEFFEPLARQYAQITNYFLPKSKPIYFVCVSAAFSSFVMFKSRLEEIDKKLYPNGKPKQEPRKESNIDPGQARNGQEFPGETPLVHVSH